MFELPSVYPYSLFYFVGFDLTLVRSFQGRHILETNKPSTTSFSLTMNDELKQNSAPIFLSSVIKVCSFYHSFSLTYGLFSSLSLYLAEEMSFFLLFYFSTRYWEGGGTMVPFLFTFSFVNRKSAAT